MEYFIHIIGFPPDQSNNLDVYFMVNGNIYNDNLPMSTIDYPCNCGLFGCSKCEANALQPTPPSKYLATSYQNAYETAFEAEGNRALNNYQEITYEGVLNNIYPGWIDGTFGYKEKYPNLPYILNLIENTLIYQSQPYLFISTGSGGGYGYMYLNWIITTFGVPYILIIP